MAVFEIQFDARAFLDAQLARFRSAPFCPPSVDIGSQSIQIQRLEYGDNSIRRGPARSWPIRYRDSYRGSAPQYLVWTDNQADGFAVHIVQTVSIQTSSLDAVLESPNAPPPPL